MAGNYGLGRKLSCTVLNRIPAFSNQERGLRVPRSTFEPKQQVTVGWKKNCMMGFMDCTPGQTLCKDYQIEASEGSMEGKYDDNNNNDKNLGVSSTHIYIIIS
jgi:hypothetical protein